MDYGHTGAEYYQQQHDGFIFSPRERASAETELHTTTLTYSDDPHPTPKSIHYTNKGFPHQQHSHHRYNPHQQQKQQHAGSVSVSEDRTQASSRDEAIMPEPMVSILQPTPVADSVRSSAHDPSGRLHLQTEEQKAGPPPPVPEPTPEHTIAGSDMLHRRDHDAEQLHSHKQHPPAGLRSDDGHGHGHPGEVDAQENRRKRTVRRVTTLIIETQTIIGPPRATMPAHLKAESRTKPSRSLGDHPMFDAGVEGDMVASIVHSEQGLRQEHDPPRRHVERNKEKKPATLK
ncbi:hypothetical protein BGZ54_008236 [Gamsiella multidivaricata]|nr:hypothetical protein BGZ54_008236 [Gamsiella multidivaricata]